LAGRNYWERERLARTLILKRSFCVATGSRFALNAGKGAADPAMTAPFLKRNRSLVLTFNYEGNLF
jgi:hypothetical protein